MGIKFLVSVLCFLLIHQARAGDQKGNGGYSVDCGKSSYLYDFYRNPGTYPESTQNEVDLVHSVLDKISLFSPVRAEQYREKLKSFFKEVNFVKGSLGYTGDAGSDGRYTPLPAGCKMVQAALQKLVGFGNEKRYFISLEQWDKLTNMHKAGLILHELIYLELQAKDSYKLGKFNAYLFSNFSNELNKKEFYTIFKDAGFQWVYLFGIPMNATSLLISDEVVTSMATFPDKPFEILDQQVWSEKQLIAAYPTGVPKQLNYRGELKFEHKELRFRICAKDIRGCKVNFNPDRSILRLNQVEVFNINTNKVESGKTIEFKSGEPHVIP